MWTTSIYPMTGTKTVRATRGQGSSSDCRHRRSGGDRRGDRSGSHPLSRCGRALRRKLWNADHPRTGRPRPWCRGTGWQRRGRCGAAVRADVARSRGRVTSGSYAAGRWAGRPHIRGGRGRRSRWRVRTPPASKTTTAGHEGEAMWPIVGLSYGTVLGLAGAFGGLTAFVLVLVLGLVGFVAGRAMEGEIDLAEVFTRRSA